MLRLERGYLAVKSDLSSAIFQDACDACPVGCFPSCYITGLLRPKGRPKKVRNRYDQGPQALKYLQRRAALDLPHSGIELSSNDLVNRDKTVRTSRFL